MIRTDDDVLATARELAERARSLQSFISGGKPPAPGPRLLTPRPLPWKAAAKKYRAEANRLSICLDHTIETNELLFEQMTEELAEARAEAQRLREQLTGGAQ